MPVLYTAFGGMRVTVNDVTTAISRVRERQVLATLIAARNVPVTADKLATDLWGPQAGPTTIGLVQVAVSRLRSLLEPDRTARGGRRIVSTAGGYLLAASAQDVDVWRFEDRAIRILDDASSAEQVVSDVVEAQAPWSQPYAGLDVPEPRAHADRLEELHVDLQVEHGRALLDLGRPDAAARTLSRIASDHPFREPLWCLLALAHYRSGRQADALATLRQLRRTMTAELGVDPAPSTARLERSILDQDADLFSQTFLRRGPLRLRPPVPLTATSEAQTGIVGRESALQAGSALLEEALALATTRTVLVAGEPGVGKTAYLTQLAQLATGAGFDVLIGRTHADRVAPALWPWIEVVRPLLADADPEVRAVLMPIVNQERTPGAHSRPLRTYDAVLDLLTISARHRPLLLVVEDLHWADTASLQLLRHVIRAQPAVPLVIALSRRTTEPPGAALLDALAEVSRAGVLRIRLDGLALAEVEELLVGALGQDAAHLAGIVADTTGGNPFFVLQYAALLATLGDLDMLDPATLDVPEGVRTVLRQRLHQLPDPVLTIVAAAGVLGRFVNPEVLALLVDRPLEEVLNALDVAVGAGLLVEERSAYGFVHDLAVGAAYDELSVARRVRMHDRAGRIVEDRAGGNVDAVNVISRHTWAASSLSVEHLDRARSWRIQSARAALDRHAAVEALQLWREVLSVTAAGSDASARAHGGAAVSLLYLSAIAEAGVEIEAGVQEAWANESWDLVAELVGTLAVVGSWSWPGHGPGHHKFIEVLLDTQAKVDARARAVLLSVLEVELYICGEFERRGQYAPVALEIVRELGEDDLRLRVLLFVVTGTTGVWPAAQRLALVHEALDLGPTDELHVSALLSLAVVEWENRHQQAADEAMARCAEVALDLRLRALDLPLAWWRATRARDRAADEADVALDGALQAHRDSGAGAYEDALVIAAIRYRDGPGVRERISSCGPPRSWTLWSVAELALREAGDLGPPPPAWASSWPGPDRAEAGAGGRGGPEYSLLAGQCFRLALLADQLRRGGEPAAASETRDQLSSAVNVLEPRRGETVTISAVVDHCGVVDHFLADAYAALGDPRAVETATAALDANQALGVLPWARRSQALLASLTSGGATAAGPAG